MTTIKAHEKDRDIIAESCAEHGIQYYFMENIKGELMTVVIYSDSPAVMWHLGRMVQLRVEMKDFIAPVDGEV